MVDVFGRRAAVALVLSLAAGAAHAASNSPEAPASGAQQNLALRCPKVPTTGMPRYVNNVVAYVADLKPSFSGNPFYKPATALTDANYRDVLNGLKTRAGVNGVRMPIFPDSDASHYSKIYNDAYDYARSIGLLIYASPSAVGMKPFKDPKWTNAYYASWLVDYARKFHPDVLSPFNEADRGDADMIAIAKLVRDGLQAGGPTGSTKLMGPDGEHVGYSLDKLKQSKDLAQAFELIGSHNAGFDLSDTRKEWNDLVEHAEHRPVWSSESPVTWKQERGGVQLGMNQAVEGGVSGVVSWMAKPGLVDGAGNPTPKACAIADGIIR